MQKKISDKIQYPFFIITLNKLGEKNHMQNAIGAFFTRKETSSEIGKKFLPKN